jgi:FG-GAP-like repeat
VQASFPLVLTASIVGTNLTGTVVFTALTSGGAVVLCAAAPLTNVTSTGATATCNQSISLLGNVTVAAQYSGDENNLPSVGTLVGNLIVTQTLSAIDLSGDNRSDILLHNTDGSLYTLLMNGTASTSGAYLTTGNTWNVAGVGDLNGDGKADIVLRHTDGSLYMLLMDGTTVTSGAYLTTGNTWSLIGMADYNGDGKADIILRQTDGSLYILLMNGTTVQSGAYLTTGNTWDLANTNASVTPPSAANAANQTDLNGDGKADIILRQTDGSLYMLLMNGTTVISGAYLTTGNTWTLANAGNTDLNGDGKSDIILRQTDGSLYMLLMNGTTVTSGAYLTTGATWTLANTSSNTSNTDLNGDGKADIILKHTDGSLYLLLMNGTAVSSGAYLTTGNTWSFRTTADYNGDGKSDIVLQHNTDGSSYILLMNGTAVTSGAYLLGPASPWVVLP